VTRRGSAPSEAAAAEFLAERYDDVRDVRRVPRGEWSRAFTFLGDGQPLVVRFGQHRRDYEKDRVAASWDQPGLPVPPVIAIGDAFDGAFAISVRAFGDALEELDADRWRRVLPALLDTLAAIRAVPLSGAGFGRWGPDGGAPGTRWGEWLLTVGQDSADGRLPGWQDRLFAAPLARLQFDQVYALLADCTAGLPDVRCLVHADLTAGNVLVDGDAIAAVFDWGASIAGDPVYEIAWLSFWQPWHRGLAEIDVIRPGEERFADADFAARLRAAQLHVGLEDLIYCAYVGRWTQLDEVARRALELARAGS
jgi:hygromycin-B 4-O-kinase